MLPLKKSTAIAFHLVIALRRLGVDNVTTEHLSAALGIPRQNLVRIVRRLTRGGIVRTAKGRGGGITLSSDVGKLSIAELFVLIEGDPSLSPNEHSDSEADFLDEIVSHAIAAFLDVLDNRTLDDLPALAVSLAQPDQDGVDLLSGDRPDDA